MLSDPRKGLDWVDFEEEPMTYHIRIKIKRKIALYSSNLERFACIWYIKLPNRCVQCHQSNTKIPKDTFRFHNVLTLERKGCPYYLETASGTRACVSLEGQECESAENWAT